MGRKLKKVGNFLKKHRREIIIGVCGITGGLIGYKLSKPTIPMKIWDKSSVKKSERFYQMFQERLAAYLNWEVIPL